MQSHIHLEFGLGLAERNLFYKKIELRKWTKLKSYLTSPIIS